MKNQTLDFGGFVGGCLCMLLAIKAEDIVQTFVFGIAAAAGTWAFKFMVGEIKTLYKHLTKKNNDEN
jgi:hypothetical protein